MRVRRSGGTGTGAVAAALLALVAVACGYKPLDGRDVFGPDVRTIELQAFENASREPGLEQQVADALNEEFARRGWLEPELVRGKSDLVMSGVLHLADVRSNSFSSGGLALEERVEVRFDVSVRRAASGELVYQHPDFRMTEVFLSSADPQVYASNKEQALRRVSSAIAERVHDELFQRF
jgi:Lipopolysaccharide-assembly